MIWAGPCRVCTGMQAAAYQPDPVLEWLETLAGEGVVRWASPEALIARRQHELENPTQ